MGQNRSSKDIIVFSMAILILIAGAGYALNQSFTTVKTPTEAVNTFDVTESSDQSQNEQITDNSASQTQTESTAEIVTQTETQADKGYNMTTEKTYWLQEQLKIAGYYCTADGSFGDQTKTALEQFTEQQMGIASAKLTPSIEQFINEYNADRLAGDIDDYRVVVNKRLNLLRSDIPSRLVPITVTHNDNVKYLEAQTNKELQKMFADATLEGVYLRVVSGYRDYDYQTMLFDNYAEKAGFDKANTYSALPGQSEHQTGYVVDLADTSGRHVLTKTFDTTPAYAWLEKNAQNYGFILSFPDGWQDRTGYMYEPWHYRYVGSADLAVAIKQSGLTLEEYLKSVSN